MLAKGNSNEIASAAKSLEDAMDSAVCKMGADCLLLANHTFSTAATVEEVARAATLIKETTSTSVIEGANILYSSEGDGRLFEVQREMEAKVKELRTKGEKENADSEERKLDELVAAMCVPFCPTRKGAAKLTRACSTPRARRVLQNPAAFALAA